MISSAQRWKLATSALLVFVTAGLALPQTQNPPAGQGKSSGPGSEPTQKESAPLNANAAEKRARRAFLNGRSAEQENKLTDAVAAYEEAVRLAPANREYRARFESARFALMQQHIELAERYAVEGKLAEARRELAAVLAIDPNYAVARERLQQLERQTLRVTDSVPPLASGPVEIQPRPGKRDFDFRGETRGAFEEIARQFSLTVAFDEDTTTRLIRFRVPGVDFGKAMRLLCQQTSTFWRAIDSRTFLVINDTPEKRRQSLPFIERSIVLPDSAPPEQMNEMARLVRDLSGVNRTQLNTATRSLSLRGPQADVDLAAALVEELEQARGEVMLEVEILEVQRDLARKLGITPPSSSRVLTLSQSDLREAQQSTEGLVNVIERLFGMPSGFSGSSSAQIAALLGTGGATLSSLVPPLIAFGGGNTVFLATLPGTRADFSETLSAIRRARRLLLRSQDGEGVTFFVGDRYPISYSVLSSGTTTAGVSPSVVINSFNVGTNPQAIIAADLRSNSHLDLVTANQGANTVTVLLGNNDGTFAAGTDIAVGQQPVALVAADFNGDGHPDLAVVNQGDKTLTILLGNGDGTFRSVNTPLAPATGGMPSGIVAADFDGDGHMDLAVTNEADNTISIFLGNGDGTFKPAVIVPIISGTGPIGIITADFNKDGRPDLAVANSTSDTVTVLLANAVAGNTPLFPSQINITVGTKPVALASADFNGDTNADLVVVNEGANTISVILGNGNGSFQSTRTDINVGGQPVAVVAADFNGDNRIDLAVANQNDGTATVLFGNGDGTFTTTVNFATGTQPSGLAAGNFTSSSTLTDLAIANSGGNSVSVVISSTGIIQPNQQQPYPSVQYEDIGLKVKATPRLHPGDEVTVHLEFEIRSLSSASLNGIPVINNRTLEQTVRLKMNEPTVLAGIYDLEKTHTVSGFPGAAGIPGLGYAAGRRDKENQETELIFMLTPRLLRRGRRIDRSLYTGRATEAGQRISTPVEQPDQ